jgi:DNA (cytosine-5)-methyltransferase 1
MKTSHGKQAARSRVGGQHKLICTAARTNQPKTIYGSSETSSCAKLAETEFAVKVLGTFSGVGGLESGLEKAGLSTKYLSEIDSYANLVLSDRFRGTENLGDVAAIFALPHCDVVAAGFPCQDLSQAGKMTGLHGSRSGLIKNVLTAVENSSHRPDFLLFENVPFLLSVHSGAGMEWLISRIEQLGYDWAYRVVDTQAFGIPQRRRRLFLLASRVADPASILLGTEDRVRPESFDEGVDHVGFYWTEGNTGLGWAPNAIPPLKSTALVASAPAIWRPEQRDFVTPTIEDAEALQGLPRGWTVAADNKAARWRLVGNAVSVPVAEWIGKRLIKDAATTCLQLGGQLGAGKWPKSAKGGPKRARIKVEAGDLPGAVNLGKIATFISPDAPKLSGRAAAGFLKRLEASRLRVPDGFLADLRYFVSNAQATKADNIRSSEEWEGARQPS